MASQTFLPSDPGRLSILVVDDDPSIVQVLEARLGSAGYKVLTAVNGSQALEIMSSQAVDLVLSDVKMPGMDGRELLETVTETWPGIPVVLLTAYGNVSDAVSSMHQGAADYISKPFDGGELVSRINRLLARAYPEEGAALDAGQGMVLGKSPCMAALSRMMRRIAPSDVSVLIQGESGTGKELVANMLHKWSHRSDGPFVVIDCGSTQPTLLESELFGHVKGAFTHAVQDKKGLIETAHSGTLFLDEIGNISPEMQTRLLRFLQERTMRRVGDTRSIEVECRVVAATNANLPDLVRAGKFREDLYFRLKVVKLEVPPLRDRLEDLPILADYFLDSLSKKSGLERPVISDQAMDRMLGYHWPGNVRELSNVLEAGVLLCPGRMLRAEDLQLEESLTGQSLNQDPMSLDESEKQAIIRALEKTGWVQKHAADILGISRRAIHYKIKKHNISIPAGNNRFDP
ncbi:sigma-54-dependent transcriptional regulator [Desulfonatronovibrio hydrogenovorans]|uniref:sigma-54-dependent transcriptional regulator n=1 Tax=Desulfonatronovibrio hydrogenovorans TaxID=53245 RepID=UPI00068E5DE0|nr:sigma-54 dependent transcriptional regulator [Desulfonatronovibrio hydrogenovorans]